MFDDPALDSLDSWERHVCKLLQTCSCSGPRYAELTPSLEHYQRVAARLLLRFADPELARAAFLHGVYPVDHPLLVDAPEVTAVIRRMLEERNRIRSIGSSLRESEGEEISRLLVVNVLPRITDPRSVVVFVFEQLDHVDPGESIAAWTLACHRTLAPLPPFAVAEEADRDAKTRIAFLRYVVAAAAEHIGLWQEAQTAQNIALLMEDPVGFAAIIDAGVSDPEWAALAERRVQRVRELLPTSVPQRIEWGWHSGAAMYSHLGSDWTLTTVRRRLDRMGYVAIECRDEADCYATLGRLHAAANYQANSIRDFIGTPRLSGYQALHTVLTSAPDEPRDFEELTPIHIFTGPAAVERLRPTSATQLTRLMQQRTAVFDTLRVFAPDGRSFDLPQGATVLNFALKIHHHFLPYLRGATVNRRPVSVTHALEDGDVVWLDIDKTTPQPLPHGWEDKVPDGTRSRINRAFRQAYRPTLIELGREWLRQRVAQKAFPSDNIDAIVEEAESTLHDRPRGSDWLLRALGIHALRERGVETLSPVLDADAVANFVRIVVRRCETISVRDELDLPQALRRHVESATLCRVCNPQEDDDLEGTLKRRDLTVHRKGSSCEGQRVPIRRGFRQTQNHFFVVDATNRIGIISDILAVFRQYNVDVCDVAARRMSPGWIVVRIGVDFVGVRRREAIATDLQSMPEVVKVVGPGVPRVPFFEHVLPPRPLVSAPLWAKASPFQAGLPIEDDRLFYGMQRELLDLHQEFDTAQTAKSRFVFVTGPLKTGKTSLVKAFLRQRDSDTTFPSLAYYGFPERTTWTEATAKLRGDFLEYAAAAGVIVDSECAKFEDAIVAVRRRFGKPVIVVIDEIVGLMRENSRDEEQIAAIQRFHEVVTATDGVLVIWIGPQLAARRVDPRLNKFLESGRLVVVGPLNEPEVGKLLRAAKLGPAYRIEARARVAKDVFRITAGNPYWVTEVASIMYELAQPKVSSVIAFTSDLLEDAKQRMFERERVFSDRVASPHDSHSEESRTLKETILLQLIADGDLALSAEAICTRLEVHTAAKRAKLNEALEELRLSGTLSLKKTDYCIQAPILADYIRFRGAIQVRES